MSTYASTPTSWSEYNVVPVNHARSGGNKQERFVAPFLPTVKAPTRQYEPVRTSISSDSSSNDNNDGLETLLEGLGIHQAPPLRSSVSSDTSSTDDNDGLTSLLESLAISQRPRPAAEYCGRDIPKDASMTVEPVDALSNRAIVHFTRPGHNIPSLELPIRSTTTKTAAVLRRGDDDPLVVAVSGWSNTFPMDHSYVLDKKLATDRVFKMCAIIGHELGKKAKMDRGRPGAFSACHVEKQLLASVFFDEKEVDEVEIFVSRKPCQDCESCIEKFVEVMGVEVKLRYRR